MTKNFERDVPKWWMVGHYYMHGTYASVFALSRILEAEPVPARKEVYEATSDQWRMTLRDFKYENGCTMYRDLHTIYSDSQVRLHWLAQTMSQKLRNLCVFVAKDGVDVTVYENGVEANHHLAV